MYNAFAMAHGRNGLPVCILSAFQYASGSRKSGSAAENNASRHSGKAGGQSFADTIYGSKRSSCFHLGLLLCYTVFCVPRLCQVGRSVRRSRSFRQGALLGCNVRWNCLSGESCRLPQRRIRRCGTFRLSSCRRSSVCSAYPCTCRKPETESVGDGLSSHRRATARSTKKSEGSELLSDCVLHISYVAANYLSIAGSAGLISAAVMLYLKTVSFARGSFPVGKKYRVKSVRSASTV